MKTKNLIYGMLWVLLMAYIPLKAQNINVEQRLQGFDQTIEKILKDWNVPGCGIGIVYKDKLVFAKGYGYRNMEKKLPVTPNTLNPIKAIPLKSESFQINWLSLFLMPIAQYRQALK